MTYAAELLTNDKRQNVAYYIAFDGLAARIATHDMTAFGLSGTFHSSIMRGTLTGRASKLDRKNSVVQPGGFSCKVYGTNTMLTYFRRKGGTEFQLSQPLSSSSASVYTATAGLDSTTVYIGGETITLGTYSTDRYITSTRGVNGSVARAHAGGQIGSTVPRHWQGRRVQLYAVMKDTGSEQVVGTFLMTRSPQFRNGAFELDFAGLESVLNRPVMTGWQEQEVREVDEDPTAVGFPAQAAQVLGLKVEDANDFAYNGDPTAAVRIDVGDRWGVFLLMGTTPISFGAGVLLDTVRVAFSHRFAGNLDYYDVLNTEDRITMRQAAVLVDQPRRIAARLLVSDVGDGTNGALDDYAGRDPTASGSILEPKRRTGAGIPSAWVDTDSFLQNIPEQGEMVLILDGERQLVDVWAEELAWRAGGYIHASGTQIQFTRLSPFGLRSAGTAITKTELVRSDVVAADEEDNIISRVLIKCNYHPKDGFRKTIEAVFPEDQDTLGEQQAEISIESRSLVVGGGGDRELFAQSSTAFESIVSKLERLHARYKLAGRRFAMRLPWKYSELLRLAARIRLTDARVPDLQGGRGVTNLPLEVVSYKPAYREGFVEVTAEEVLTGALYSPSAIIDSYAAKVITLRTTGPWGAGVLFESNPGQLFAANWTVRWRTAASDYANSESGTLQSVTATTVTLDVVPSTYTPVSGDLLELVDSADTSNLNSYNADVQDHAAAADTSLQVNGRTGPKWG